MTSFECNKASRARAYAYAYVWSPFDSARLLFRFCCLFVRNAFDSILFFTRFSGALGYCEPSKCYTIYFTTCSLPSMLFAARLWPTLPATKVLPEKFNSRASARAINLVRQCWLGLTWRANERMSVQASTRSHILFCFFVDVILFIR